MKKADDKKLLLGLPSGSLMEATVQLFAKAGFSISGSTRSYRPAVDDPDLEVRVLRAQEISRYVERSYLDAGITGQDWVAESGSHVREVEVLPYSKASTNPTRWVLVVPEESPVHSVYDLEGKRIATEVVSLTKDFFRKHGVDVQVEFSWGATEVKVPDLVDAIVEITETGASLQANKLRVIDTLLESYPVLVTNKCSWKNKWKRNKLESLALLLKGALDAHSLVGIKMNLPSANLENLLGALPSLRNPTVSPLAQANWVAVEAVVEEKVVREILAKLKALGAEGIIEYPLNKVVY
ncbi:ATP phosphoribosyltransferase [Candidatus Xiphinematobacter sp. Idaho Grape]|uniref:ATP phosphoribosyltransferase n=1 Tax=Candidatus Xiphinematobacter sp. Idaho Grape TaxID=1704307 RepID=UPI000705A432|nr:ATP phosphoribosyltransferase [Candidatus Xiphinematobacter sp. Idaho Grape]ALJ56699.1 ATP phosphoribosyltransferase [Candidatus Xiphinematobacter sp. Idaho Grape]